MLRREFFTRSLALCAAPLLASAAELTPHSARQYSTRAIDLVTQSHVVDMLGLLTLDWALLDRWHQSATAFTDADFEKLRSSGINVFHPAVAFDKGSSHDITTAWFGKWNRLIAAHPSYFLRVDCPSDLAQAKQEGRIGIILGMQDANHLRTVDDVDAFYKMGQRLTQLTYNLQNDLGDGCKVSRDRGLSPFGLAVVERMNSIGMAIDVSHCGERTSLDAIAASKKPVLITHSNCLALAPGVARCKSDEVIRAAASTGGVLGITSVRHFVKTKDPVTVEDVLDHFDYAVKLVGVEHVGLGSDFDLDAHPTYDIPGLNHSRRVYELTDGLLQRGYTDEQISLMLGGNFQRALQQIWS
ncbi:MAG TPA: membrane dipeptidase [Bryobacteraceae bacterium]|jgi:membrane dipeptidase|nr:membrane dipeptidase [Bryobacteraceae bacterium]